jgi:dolichol-phosphate mannosyltransferase
MPDSITPIAASVGVDSHRIRQLSAAPPEAAHLFTSGPELSVIVPTFNERDNVVELIQRLQDSLGELAWEVIFVDDDSHDDTAQLVREIGAGDRRVRCIQRVGRRGLSSACVEGMLASSAPYLAIIDGDLQHDERLLPSMLLALKSHGTELAIGSRYLPDGGIGDWDKSRAAISSFATRLSRLVLKADLSDPMSGYFMIQRQAMERCVRNLSGIGFKILVDIFASSPQPLTFVELPYKFRSREAGESKLDSHAAWEYLALLLDKLVGHLVPLRFVGFCLVGGFGVLVHFAVLGLLHQQVGLEFISSHITATVVAMTANFSLNNVLTYRDMQLRGLNWLRGWVSFTLACSVGAIANVGIAAYLIEMDTRWAIAALAGILVGTVWNYVATRLYTWKLPNTS